MEEYNWVYAGIEPSNHGNAVRLYGILKFDEKGKLITEWSWSLTGYTLLRGLVVDDSDAVKGRIVQEMRFSTEPVEGGSTSRRLSYWTKTPSKSSQGGQVRSITST